MNLGDRFLNLSPRGQKVIRESALGHFGDEIFPLINPDDFLVLYSEAGRGPSYLQGIVGAYLIQKMEHLTVDQLLMRIDTDVAVQYALHTTSLERQPFSRRNLFYFMARLDAYEEETGINLIEQCFKNITVSLQKEMGLNRPGNSGRVKKRMDSMMIASSAGRLTRAGILYAVNQEALALYAGLEGMGGIAPSLLHYFDDSDRNTVIYHNKGVLEEKLSALLKESQMILQLMREEEWHEFQEYKNLVRCTTDQGDMDGDGNLVPKANKEIRGSSLQTPEDPNATARTKAGKTHIGSVGNVAETYDEDGNSLITDADIQPNVHSDSDFMGEYIQSKPEGAPEEQVTTDGAFYSSDNAKEAAEKGILLVPTSLTGTQTNPLCADFELESDGKAVIKCPNGAVPKSQIYHENTGVIDAKFSHADCDVCPFREQCPGQSQKKAVKVSISEQMVERADLQEALGTEEHKQLAKERNAVEAIPSIFRRKYGVDDLRTFIKSRVRTAFFAICIAYNGQKHKRFLEHHRVECALS